MLQNRVKGCPAQSADYAIRHPALYKGRREGRFRLRAAECAAQCQRLLADDALRKGIAARGHERALRNNLFNEPMLTAVIERAAWAFEERR